jgi:spore germination protein GerM
MRIQPARPARPTRRWRDANRALATLALAAWAVGCGLPTDGSPRPIPSSDIPEALLEPSSTTTPEAVGNFSVDLWWLDDERLTSRARNVSDFRPSTAIASLLAGVSPEDSPADTSIPSGTELLGSREAGGVLTVNLSEQISGLQGEELKRALAQIVWTATAPAFGINRVKFQVEGSDLPVITDEGTVTEPVNRGDFRSLQPEEPTTTTVATP